MKNRIGLTLAALGLSAIMAPAFAQGTAPTAPANPPAQGGRHGGLLARLTQELNLTTAQQSQIKPILKSVGPQMRALRQDTTLSPQDKQTKMQALMQQTKSQIMPILNADQQKQLESMAGFGGKAAGGAKHGMHLEEALRSLNLNSTQVAQIKPILKNMASQNKALKQDTTMTPDQKKAQRKSIHTAALNQIMPILTADQQKKLTAMMHHRGGAGAGTGTTTGGTTGGTTTGGTTTGGSGN